MAQGLVVHNTPVFKGPFNIFNQTLLSTRGLVVKTYQGVMGRMFFLLVCLSMPWPPSKMGRAQNSGIFGVQFFERLYKCEFWRGFWTKCLPADKKEPYTRWMSSLSITKNMWIPSQVMFEISPKKLTFTLQTMVNGMLNQRLWSNLNPPFLVSNETSHFDLW